MVEMETSDILLGGFEWLVSPHEGGMRRNFQEKGDGGGRGREVWTMKSSCDGDG